MDSTLSQKFPLSEYGGKTELLTSESFMKDFVKFAVNDIGVKNQYLINDNSENMDLIIQLIEQFYTTGGGLTPFEFNKKDIHYLRSMKEWANFIEKQNIKFDQIPDEVGFAWKTIIDLFDCVVKKIFEEYKAPAKVRSSMATVYESITDKTYLNKNVLLWQEVSDSKLLEQGQEIINYGYMDINILACIYYGWLLYPDLFEREKKSKSVFEIALKLADISGIVAVDYYNQRLTIVDYPVADHRDADNELHGDGEPALEYTDGTKYYYHHGVVIPDKWGETPTYQWDPRWLMETSNQDQRRLLIHVVGSQKIFDAFKHTVIDENDEQKLVRIDEDIDVEKMHLLMVKCPSTSDSYVLRVDPEARTCEEARLGTFPLMKMFDGGGQSRKFFEET